MHLTSLSPAVDLETLLKKTKDFLSTSWLLIGLTNFGKMHESLLKTGSVPFSAPAPSSQPLLQQCFQGILRLRPLYPQTMPPRNYVKQELKSQKGIQELKTGVSLLLRSSEAFDIPIYPYWNKNIILFI